MNDSSVLLGECSVEVFSMVSFDDRFAANPVYRHRALDVRWSALRKGPFGPRI